MKVRITITLDGETLKKIDSLVDKKDIRNRSHAVESLIQKSLNTTGLKTALILAGGEGTRLRPITYEIPKPMIPIHGRSILEHQLNLLKKYDIRNIILCVGYMSDKIREHFGNGSRFGVKITYIEEEKPLGTGGAIKLAEPMINDSFAVLNVDTLMKPDIKNLFEFHKNEKTTATLLLDTMRPPESLGVVRMEGNRIVSFEEKPEKVVTNLVNSGLYILEPRVLKCIPKNKFCSLEKEILPKLAKNKQISGFVHNGPVYDVGTHERYEKAIKEWKDL